MATTLWKPLAGTNDYGVVDFSFSFVAKTTTADPDATLIRGEKVASITCGAQGVYVCTLSSGFAQLVSLTVDYAEPSTPVGDRVGIYPVDETADPLVLTVKYFRNAALTTANNPAAATRIYVRGSFKISSVGTNSE